MYTKKRYSAIAMVFWTLPDTLRFFLIILAWVSAYYFLDIAWLKIPWTPLALIGSAVAFVIGFQNNSAYGRIWEARQIWGGVVNTSRTFGMFAQDFISNEHSSNPKNQAELDNEIKVLTYRHIAWMTALRYAMRVPKPWETSTSIEAADKKWRLPTPEQTQGLEEAMQPYLSESDLKSVMEKDNKSTALLYQQSHHLKRLKEEGLLWEFSFLQMEGVLEELFSLQGKSERIKNFPYPRQFASLNHYFMWILILLLPVALVPQFMEIGQTLSVSHPILSEFFLWLTVPIYVIVAWVFHTMEKIGRYGENPFEGTPNDVPISTIARGIEIDLRQNLGESKETIPAQYPMQNDIQF